MTRPKIQVITTGGTIFQREQSGKMEIALNADHITTQCESNCEFSTIEISRQSGAEMTFQTLQKIAEAASNQTFDASILITGTDSMEEVAFALESIYAVPGPFAICGAMKPSDTVGYDGIANFNDAVKAVLSPIAKTTGVLVVMNDTIHCARYVRKQDSALMGSFQSHPGPIGEIRRGQAVFYYRPQDRRSGFNSFNPELADQLKVPIVTMSLGFHDLSEAMLDECDALVIAGMGTGSISARLVEQLAPKWTKAKPIVLSTRCAIGQSFDDYYYRGSLEKYESKGFRVAAHSELNPLQARLQLIGELASS